MPRQWVRAGVIGTTAVVLGLTGAVNASASYPAPDRVDYDNGCRLETWYWGMPDFEDYPHAVHVEVHRTANAPAGACDIKGGKVRITLAQNGPDPFPCKKPNENNVVHFEKHKDYGSAPNATGEFRPYVCDLGLVPGPGDIDLL